MAAGLARLRRRRAREVRDVGDLFDRLRALVVAPGLGAIYRKELADQLGSRRFGILFALILLAALSSVYTASGAIRDALAQAGSDAPAHTFLLLFTVAQDPLPPFYQFLSFLGPLVGIALAFDAVNSEQERGTLARLLAQPIHRDSVINGKFLARLTTVAIMLASIAVLVGAIGMYRLGIVPSGEELVRLLAFLVIATLFVGFWVALALGQSLVLVWPQVVGLLALTAICFAAAYIRFMRAEIRSL